MLGNKGKLMTYDDLIITIHSKVMPPNEYYTLLLDNAGTIITQTAIQSKRTIASDLGMTPQVFATAFKFITARYVQLSN